MVESLKSHDNYKTLRIGARLITKDPQTLTFVVD